MNQDELTKQKLIEYITTELEQERNLIWNRHLNKFFEEIINSVLALYRVRPSFKDDIKLAATERLSNWNAVVPSSGFSLFAAFAISAISGAALGVLISTMVTTRLQANQSFLFLLFGSMIVGTGFIDVGIFDESPKTKFPVQGDPL